MTVSCYSQLHVTAQDGRHQALYKNTKRKIGFCTNISCKCVEIVIVISKRMHVLINVV